MFLITLPVFCLLSKVHLFSDATTAKDLFGVEKSAFKIYACVVWK